MTRVGELMARTRPFHVLMATDGSASARSALGTAIRFPWPADARGSVVVARQTPAEYRRSVLLAALDRTSDVVAARGMFRSYSHIGMCQVLVLTTLHWHGLRFVARRSKSRSIRFASYELRATRDELRKVK